MNVRDFYPAISPINQLNIYFITDRKSWLGIAKPIKMSYDHL